MGAPSEPRAVLEGRAVPLAAARLPVLDAGVARGDGVFETVGVWGGRPFRLDDHLTRLQGSLDAVGLPPADLDRIRAEVAAVCDGVTGDAVLRVCVTASGTRLVTLDRLPVRADPRVLRPLPAPWVRPADAGGLSAAKAMSYLPGTAATRAARAAGADDALLVSAEGWVLEGPTFAVCAVADGVLLVPSLDLGIIDSISRRAVVELAGGLGIPVEEGRWPLAAVQAADEVLLSSSLRDVVAVRRVGDAELPAAHPVGDALRAVLRAARRGR